MKKITNANDIQVGDIAYFDSLDQGCTIYGIDDVAFAIQLPDAFMERSLMHIIKGDFDFGYRYEHKLPEFDRSQPAMFATQESIPIYYDGKYYQYGGKEYYEEDLILTLENSALKVFPLRTFIETTDWDNGTAGPRLKHSIQKAVDKTIEGEQ